MTAFIFIAFIGYTGHYEEFEATMPHHANVVL